MGRSLRPSRFTRYLALGLVLLVALPTDAAEWFGNVYRKRAEFAVTAKSLGPQNGATPHTYVLLHAAPDGELIDPQPVNLDKSELWKATAAALDRAGFTPASTSDEADLAVVVTYGRGLYPPPFEFMGVDPEALASFRWPRLLLHYDQQYHRRDYFNADVSGGPASVFDATDADRVNFIAVRAFDARELRARKTWTLRWETRVTVDAKNRPLEKFLPAMIAAAGRSFGRDDRSGSIFSAPVRDGVVEIGQLQVVDPSATATAPSSK
ncbi:MAG: hypothetical protein JNN01_24775 [Opitutaceae bacterium]|nr:hypothetical protein [Opitutaceae bacterium]